MKNYLARILLVVAALLVSGWCQAGWEVFSQEEASARSGIAGCRSFRVPLAAFEAAARQLLRNENSPFYCHYGLTLNGSISKSDAIEYVNFQRKLKANILDIPPVLHPSIYEVDSPGGDVFAAVQIGRALRKSSTRPFVMVSGGAICASACTFILAAGISRFVDENEPGVREAGRIGIHRVKMNDDAYLSLSIDQQVATYRSNRDFLRTYFQEMNIDPAIVDHMWRIPSSKMHWLSREEMDRYGLSRADPAMEEKTIAVYRRVCGFQPSDDDALEQRCAHQTGDIHKKVQCKVALIQGCSAKVIEYRRDQ